MKKMLQWFLQGRGASGIKVLFIRKSYIVLLLIFLALLNFTLLFIVIIKTGKLEKQITGNEDIRNALLKTSDEINLLREVLGFPPAFISELDSAAENKNELNDRAYGYEAYYSAFEKLYSDYKKQKLTKILKEYLASIKGYLDSYNLIIVQEEVSEDVTFYLKKNGEAYYILKIDNSSDQIKTASYPFEKYIDAGNEKIIKDFINNSFTEIETLFAESLSVKAKTRAFIESAEIKKILSKDKIHAVPANVENNEDSIIKLYNLNRETGQTVGEVSYSYKNKKIMLNDIAFDNIEDFKKAVIIIKDVIDIKTNEEKAFKKSFDDIIRMINDPSFKSYLEDKGFYISEEPREDADYQYFDIRKIEDRTVLIGSFAIHKISGTIYLTDFDEVPVSSIKSFGMGSITKDAVSKKKI
ncbi:MAG: hypothetical protein H7A26_02665 [Spirochaetales bacterium]|nr:hypothetical protein [Spirochaetales bacterium]